jgi:ATP-dependent DNA helicase RecQ
MIFPDSTLVDMCGKLPQNGDELLNVSGVGQAKLKKYGEAFLAMITKYREAVARDEQNAPWK